MAGETDVKVALITGGADGMGLAIAQALVHAPDARCKVHLVDIKQDAGHRAVAALGGPEHAVFHEADVTDYEQLAAAFRAAFLDDGGGGQGRRRPSSAGRLDYVFANAGIFERQKYFPDQEDSTSSDKDDDEPPPAPDYVALDVNVKGAINTVHLARHYIARSPDVQAGSIVITASCSSFWPTYWAPIYTASKFGILGFLRAVAGHFKAADNIRVNALCPGAMRTAIVPTAAWAPFPDDVFTPLEAIARVALQLARGDAAVVDARGVDIAPGAYGQAVVVHGRHFYLQPEPAYCDEAMRQTMESTRVDKH